jgi:hypothetical protein
MSEAETVIDRVVDMPEEEIDLNSFLLDGHSMFPHVIVQLAYDPVELFMQADALSRELTDVEPPEQS